MPPDPSDALPTDPPAQPARVWGGLSLSALRDVRVLAALAVIPVIVFMAWMWRPSDYKVLFANVPDAEGAAIVAALQQMNVPYRYSEGGAAILVPQGQVHDVRLKLAGQGLPKSATVGFELLENQKFGTSQFVERVNYLRGLEGELAKSIASISQVKAARVHLVVPKPSAFAREQEKPRASVLITLHPGRLMDPSQSAAITRLISAAVPGLQPQDVSLLDTEGGRLLSVNSPATDLDANQLRHAQEIEQILSQRLGAMLEPLTGRDGYRVQVSVELNFDERERTEEVYARNPDASRQSVRSEQWRESAGANAARPGGVPGALSNQAQTPAEAPVWREPPREAPIPTPSSERGSRQLQAPGPVETGQGWGDATASGAKRERTVNYELDRTVERYKKGRGQIRRLTAAVLIDDKPVSVGGKRQAFTATEIDEIKRLVRDALGFDSERGDTVTVTNLPFGAQLRELATETPADTPAVSTTVTSVLAVVAAWTEVQWMSAGAALVAVLALLAWSRWRARRAQRVAAERTDPAAQRASDPGLVPSEDEASAWAQQRAKWQSSQDAPLGDVAPGGVSASTPAQPNTESPDWQQNRQRIYNELMKYLRDYAAQQPDKMALYLHAWMVEKDPVSSAPVSDEGVVPQAEVS